MPSCRVVGAEDIHFWPQAERGFDRDLDQVGSSFGRLAGATKPVGAGDIEITQDHIAQAMGGAGIAQHDLGHQLRGAIGRRRHRGIVFAHRNALRIAVDRGGRRENGIAYAPFDGALDQRERVHRIVMVIAERIANRVRRDGRGGEMDNGVDPVLRDQRSHARLISDVTDDERRALRDCQSKPVARLSSTTTRSPASTSARTMWLPI